MDRKELVKTQFNRQALRFSNWSVTKNREYMERYFEFCELAPNDRLLDVACGSGEFALFCAQRICSVDGMDISDRLIELATERTKLEGLENVTFHCHDVEQIPFESDTYHVVLCRSAFHHFDRPRNVFREMVRLAKKGGRISVQDIVTYLDPQVNAYFESLETAIDRSHHRTLGRNEFMELFRESNLKVVKATEIQIQLDVEEYINHAIQSPESGLKVRLLLNQGRKDERIAPFFIERENVLSFKRDVFMGLVIKA